MALRDRIRSRTTTPLDTPDSLRSQVIAATGTDTPAPPPAPTPAPASPAPSGPTAATPPPPGGQPAGSTPPAPVGGAPAPADSAAGNEDWGTVEEDHNPPPALPRSALSRREADSDPKEKELFDLEGRFDLSKLKDTK